MLPNKTGWFGGFRFPRTTPHSVEIDDGDGTGKTHENTSEYGQFNRFNTHHTWCVFFFWLIDDTDSKEREIQKNWTEKP